MCKFLVQEESVIFWSHLDLVYSFEYTPIILYGINNACCFAHNWLINNHINILHIFFLENHGYISGGAKWVKKSDKSCGTFDWSWNLSLIYLCDRRKTIATVSAHNYSTKKCSKSILHHQLIMKFLSRLLPDLKYTSLILYWIKALWTKQTIIFFYISVFPKFHLVYFFT